MTLIQEIKTWSKKRLTNALKIAAQWSSETNDRSVMELQKIDADAYSAYLWTIFECQPTEAENASQDN